jgi:hypothetical protein
MLPNSTLLGPWPGGRVAESGTAVLGLAVVMLSCTAAWSAAESCVADRLLNGQVCSCSTSVLCLLHGGQEAVPGPLLQLPLLRATATGSCLWFRASSQSTMCPCRAAALAHMPVNSTGPRAGS